MRFLSSLLLLALLAAALPASAGCSSSSATLADAGGVQVTQASSDCSEDWGNNGFSDSLRSVRAEGAGAKAEVGVRQYASHSSWGGSGYDYATREVRLDAEAGGQHVEGWVLYITQNYYYEGQPDYCYSVLAVAVSPVAGFLTYTPCAFALATPFPLP